MKPICSLACRQAVRTALGLAFLCGLAGQSPAQTIDLLPLTGAVWRFDDSARDQGTAWKEISFAEETNWHTGTGLFGLEPTVPYPYPTAISTPLVLGANRITYYFRTQFELTNAPSTVVVQGTAYVDDGAVFYLNGQEIGRVRMVDQPVTYLSKAQLANPEGLAYSWTIPSSALVLGSNVMAVEVHQNNSSSSDVLFGLGLQGTVAAGPSILNTNEPSDRIVLQGQPTTLSVMGAGVPAPTYQWYRNGSPVAGATASALTLASVTAANAGQYYVVLANSVGTVTSRVAQVSFLADTNPPTILFAIGRTPNTFEVVFSEPIRAEYLDDLINWAIEPAGGGAQLVIDGAVVHSLTNVTYSTAQLRDPATSYVFLNTTEIPDLNDNLMPFGTTVPIATFATPFMALTNQTWRFEVTGTDPGPGWEAGAFNDGAWPMGLGVFDAFRPQPDSPPPLCRPNVAGTMEVVGTCIALSNAQSTAQLSAAYFRTHFQFAGNTSNSVLQFRVLVDDGAVVYLNGVELFRAGMAAGAVANATLANRVVPNPVWETIELASTALVAGDNVLAVELHQESLSSPDFTFGLELTGVLPAPAAQQRAQVAPRLQAARAQGGFEVSWLPEGGRLQSALDAAGPWLDVAAGQPGRYHDSLTASRKFFRVIVP